MKKQNDNRVQTYIKNMDSLHHKDLEGGQTAHTHTQEARPNLATSSVLGESIIKRKCVQEALKMD